MPKLGLEIIALVSVRFVTLNSRIPWRFDDDDIDR